MLRKPGELLLKSTLKIPRKCGSFEVKYKEIFTQYLVSTLLTSSYFITHVCASDIFHFIHMYVFF